jgi:hypothetical protein
MSKFQKIENLVQHQETKFQPVAPKYRELFESELEVVVGGSFQLFGPTKN